MKKTQGRWIGLRSAIWTLLFFVVCGALIGFGVGVFGNRQAYVAQTTLSLDSADESELTGSTGEDTLAKAAAEIAVSSAIAEQVKEELELTYSSIEMRTILSAKPVDEDTLVLKASGATAQEAADIANRSAELLAKSIRSIAGSTAVNVDEKAQPPAHPSSEHADRMMAYGAGFGLYIALLCLTLFGLIREFYRGLHTHVRSVDDLRKGQLPVLAEFSSCSDADPLDLSMEEHQEYDELRLTLECYRKENTSSVLLITSTRQEEGKSRLAANLAVSYAQSGRNTLLIDADMQNASLHRVFGLPLEGGLSECVQKNRLLPKVHGTAVHGLSVLTAGAKPEHSDALLEEEAFRKLFATLVLRYDAVLVNAPAVLEQRDTELLTQDVHLGLLSVELGTTRRRELETAQDILADCNVKIAGLVIQDIS